MSIPVARRSAPRVVEFIAVTMALFRLIRTYLPKTLQQPANILDAYGEVMMTQTASMLPVSGGNASIDFYGAAFARSCFGA
jgi:hypothetical protein